MLTTTRRDQRTRRQALFTLESLDDRLVLSAGAAGAAAAEAAGAAGTSHAALVAQRHEAKLARVEARHEAKLARVEARHEAKLARVEARHEAKLAAYAAVHPTLSAPTALPLTPAAASASASAASTASPTVASSSSSSGSGAAVSAAPTSSGGSGVTAQAVSTTTTTTTASSPAPSPGPLSANVAAALQSLYTEYENAGSGTFTPSQPGDKLLQISGDSVEVTLKIGSGTDFNTALSQLQSDGMQVTSSSSTYALIDGMLPISELPAASQIASSVNPVPPPMMS